MKKLVICKVLMLAVLISSVFAQPKPPKKNKKDLGPKFINPLQEINLTGEVFTKGKGYKKQVLFRDMEDNVYTLSVDEANSPLYYEDLFIYDGYTVNIVGTYDTRTSIIDVKLIQVKNLPGKKKAPVPPKKDVKPPKKESGPVPPKKDPLPPKKNDSPKPPKK